MQPTTQPSDSDDTRKFRSNLNTQTLKNSYNCWPSYSKKERRINGQRICELHTEKFRNATNRHMISLVYQRHMDEEKNDYKRKMREEFRYLIFNQGSQFELCLVRLSFDWLTSLEEPEELSKTRGAKEQTKDRQLLRTVCPFVSN